MNRARELSPAVETVADAMSARRPLSAVFKAFAPRVVLHMGPIPTTLTAPGWISWIEYLRAHGGVSGLRTEMEAVEYGPNGTVHVTGWWVGQRAGRPVSSDLADVIYRVSEGKIVELWTSPKNYTLMLGKWAGNLLGFSLAYLRFRIWAARRPASGVPRQDVSA